MKTSFPSRHQPLRATLALAAALLLAACASTPPPVAEMAVATAAISRAEAGVATSGDATANATLRTATAKLAQARAAVTAKDHDTARRLADQAALDAQLAEQQAQTLRSRKAAQESADAARALRAEIDRKPL